MDLSNENVLHIVKDGVEYLQFRKLLEYKDTINHAYSLGLDVNFRTAKIDKTALPKEEYEHAINCYKKLCEKIGSNYKNIVKTNQEHTDEVKKIEKKINQDEPDFNLEIYKATDGMIIDKPNIMLSTTNADCILLLMFDPVKKAIANVHSGWKGTLQRISVKAIEKMQKDYGCNAKDIIVCICPSIRKCHFEVDKDVKDMFTHEFQEMNLEEIIESKVQNNKWNIDTVKINQIMLQDKGVLPENIIDCGICSVCNCTKIHSYRVEKEGYGLETALIELRR